MSSTTTQNVVEITSRPRTTSPRVRPEIEPSTSPAHGHFEDRWPFIAMILSLCLFAAVFAKTVLQPAAATISTMSEDHWTEGP
jgi:hypothetical protein